MSVHEDATDVEYPPEDETFDCPGCAVESEAWPRAVIEVEGDYWHPLCLLEAHHQIETREPKECPDCGAQSPYHPVTRGPEARSC